MTNQNKSRRQSFRPDINLRIAEWATISYVAVVAVAGGASRGDDFSQTVVRLTAIVTAALILILRPGAINRRDALVPLGFLAAIAVLILIQLVPLPPVVWTQLPGRAFSVHSYELASIPLNWHPISLTPDQGLNTTLSLLPVACALTALSALPKARSQAALALVIVAVASSLTGLFQLGSDFSAGLPDGFFANRNHQALLLASAIPALGLVISKQRVSFVLDVVAAALVIFLVLLIALTGSRSGILTTSIGMCGGIYFLTARITARSSLRAAIVGLAGLAIVTAVGAFAYLSGKLLVFQRLGSINSSEDTRIRVLQPLFDMVAAYFPIGSGFGSFDSAFRQFERVQDLNFDYFNHAHNDFIEAAIEGGLPAIFLMVLFAIWWARSSFIIWRAARDIDFDLARLGTLISGMILLASLLDYPARTPLIACLLALACYWMHYVSATSYIMSGNGVLAASVLEMDTTEK